MFRSDQGKFSKIDERIVGDLCLDGVERKIAWGVVTIWTGKVRGWGWMGSDGLAR